MPRVFLFRTLILFLVFILVLAFWLFYVVSILQRSTKSDYHSIVLYATSLVDSLLFVHYMAIIIVEIRHLQPTYCVRITRAPDGEERMYSIGQLSIQRAAAWCLEHYYRDFTAYNPYMELATSKRYQQNKKAASFKLYDVDGVDEPNGSVSNNERAGTMPLFPGSSRRGQLPRNDRFYVEEEFQRRLKRRKARLMSCAEDAFSHIKRLQQSKGPAIAMDPTEAAQAVFPSLARGLQKYLRITRQQPKYTLDSILDHLAVCIKYDMGPTAFVQKYLEQGPVIMNDKEFRSTQDWVLICEMFVSRAIEDGTVFQLKQGDVSLLITVRKLPHFNITEEVIDRKYNKFVLKLNSETSV